ARLPAGPTSWARISRSCEAWPGRPKAPESLPSYASPVLTGLGRADLASLAVVGAHGLQIADVAFCIWDCSDGRGLAFLVARARAALSSGARQDPRGHRGAHTDAPTIS